MRQRDLAELFGLAAIWGGSFLLMRVAAPAFGAIALAGLRVIGAALYLLVIVALRREWPALRRHWRPLLIVGFTNSALPFALFSHAALSITAGLSSIFNAATPLFAAAIAWLWLKDPLSPSRIVGLLIGFAGVFGLAWSNASVKTGADDLSSVLAVLACVVASISYGFSANYTKQRLSGVSPMAVAAGSQVGAALILIGPTLWLWPASMPDAAAWSHVALLAVLCTGVAYLLYFRLIANVGPSNAITVTFLVPAFAVAWGALLLGELVTTPMLIGCGVILFGTSLATGLLQRQPWLRRPARGR
jgi:drug/metabolite transporter (DMT)-like permease